MDNQKYIEDIKNKAKGLAETILKFFLINFPQRDFKKADLATGYILTDSHKNELRLFYSEHIFREEPAITITIVPSRENFYLPLNNFILTIKQLTPEFFELLEKALACGDKEPKNAAATYEASFFKSEAYLADLELYTKELQEIYAEITKIPGTRNLGFRVE